MKQTHLTFKQFLDTLVLDKTLQPDTHNGRLRTWCNFAAAYILQFKNDGSFWRKSGSLPYLANDQINIMETCENFAEITMQEAIKMSNLDWLVFACSKGEEHGHICALYPAPSEMSGSWDGYVPMVANIGKKNGIVKLSYAWRAKDKEKVKFYLYKGE